MSPARALEPAVSASAGSSRFAPDDDHVGPQVPRPLDRRGDGAPSTSTTSCRSSGSPSGCAAGPGRVEDGTTRLTRGSTGRRRDRRPVRSEDCAALHPRGRPARRPVPRPSFVSWWTSRGSSFRRRLQAVRWLWGCRPHDGTGGIRAASYGRPTARFAHRPRIRGSTQAAGNTCPDGRARRRALALAREPSAGRARAGPERRAGSSGAARGRRARRLAHGAAQRRRPRARVQVRGAARRPASAVSTATVLGRARSLAWTRRGATRRTVQPVARGPRRRTARARAGRRQTRQKHEAGDVHHARVGRPEPTAAFLPPARLGRMVELASARDRVSRTPGSHPAPAEHVQDRAQHDLDVDPERPVGEVEVVDRDHLAERHARSSRGSASGPVMPGRQVQRAGGASPGRARPRRRPAGAGRPGSCRRAAR